jgi:hypothetical protein
MPESDHITKMITSCDFSGTKLSPEQILKFQEYTDSTKFKSRILNALIVILAFAISSIILFSFTHGVDGAMKLAQGLASFLLAGLGWVSGQLFERKKSK